MQCRKLSWLTYTVNVDYANTYYVSIIFSHWGFPWPSGSHFKLMCIYCIFIFPLSLKVHRVFQLNNGSVSIHGTTAPGINICLDINNFPLMPLSKIIFYLPAKLAVNRHEDFFCLFLFLPFFILRFQPLHLFTVKFFLVTMNVDKPSPHFCEMFRPIWDN